MTRLVMAVWMAAVALTVPATGVGTAKAAVVAQATPDVAARDFYRWYLGLMVKDKEASDDAAGYARYVTAPLRQRIKRQMDSPDGMDVDYFIKAQDYLDDWAGHIAVAKPVSAGGNARVVVTLGLAKPHPWRLAVVMQREGGSWKVAQVTKI